MPSVKLNISEQSLRPTKVIQIYYSVGSQFGYSQGIALKTESEVIPYSAVLDVSVALEILNDTVGNNLPFEFFNQGNGIGQRISYGLIPNIGYGSEPLLPFAIKVDLNIRQRMIILRVETKREAVIQRSDCQYDVKYVEIKPKQFNQLVKSFSA